jgi:hypothetical protein
MKIFLQSKHKKHIVLSSKIETLSKFSTKDSKMIKKVLGLAASLGKVEYRVGEYSIKRFVLVVLFEMLYQKF